MRQFLLAAFLMIAVEAPAQAEITLTKVENEGGLLVVRGETSRSNQLVTLDGKYRTHTDSYKEFRFRIRYLPRDCAIKLRAGQEERPARIANCDMVLPLTGTTSDNSTRSVQTKGAQMRVVRQPCSKDEECRVICDEEEFAVNAYCPGAEAKILNERAIGCTTSNSSQIVAYCLAPGRK